MSKIFSFRRENPYFKINREERHLSAILFHLLALPGNIEKLSQYAGCDWEFDPNKCEVYFEYSYLRDLWFAMGENDDNCKRDVIVEMLGQSGASEKFLKGLRDPAIYPNPKFNEFFIGSGDAKRRKASQHIESPANWHLPAFASNKQIEDDDLVAVCKLKWSFRVKPDLVIHTDPDRALCMELKFESEESSYPSDGDEKEILRKRELFCERGKCVFPIGQTELQKFMMEKLLGLECRFLYISCAADNAPIKLSWRTLHDMLDPKKNLPDYMESALHLAACKSK
jgi:hypothetical protein